MKSKQVKTTISLIGLAMVMAGCKGGGNEVYAVVNGESISKDEYISHLERKINVLVQTPQGPITAQVAQPLNFQALNDLVNQRLLLQMAKEEGVLPNQQDVQTELGFQEEKTPGFVKTLTSQGLTMTDIKNELLINLCRYKILSKGVTISDEQVEKYIKENPKRFQNPKTIDLTWIVVRSEKDKASVDSDLRANQIFSTVAKVQSIAPNGPVYPSRIYDQFPPRLKQVVDNLAEGGTSQWLQDSGSWVKFHVEKKTEASEIKIKPWMKVEIRKALEQEKGAVALDLDKRLLDMRKNAKIDITKTGLKERFEQLSKTLKEADMKSGTSSASSAAATNEPKDPNAGN